MKSGISILNNINKEFKKKAKIEDILFLTFLLVIPFFMEYVLISLFVFSNIGLFYMYQVINRVEFIFHCFYNE